MMVQCPDGEIICFWYITVSTIYSPQVKHKRDIEVIFHPALLLVVGI